MEPPELITLLNTCMVLSLIATLGLLIYRLCANEEPPSHDLLVFLYVDYQKKNQDIQIIVGTCVFLFFSWARALAQT